jgi:hypothetical protein
MTRSCALAGTAVLMALLAAPAQATPILEQTVMATEDDTLVLTFLNGAPFTSQVFLDGALEESGVSVDTQAPETGAPVALERFAEALTTGRELETVVSVVPAVHPDDNGAGVPDGSGGTIGSGGGTDGSGGGPVESGGGTVGSGGTGGSGGTIGSGGEIGSGGGTVGSGGTIGSSPSPDLGGGPVGGGPVGAGPVAPVVVDEPANLLLLGTGLLMVGVAMRRQTIRRRL